MKTHCKNGHEWKPDNLTKRGGCRACQSVYAKKHYAENKEKISVSMKKYYAENKEKTAVYEKKRWSKDIDSLSDSYIRARIKLSSSGIPPELIEAKRLELRLFRSIRHAKRNRDQNNRAS